MHIEKKASRIGEDITDVDAVEGKKNAYSC